MAEVVARCFAEVEVFDTYNDAVDTYSDVCDTYSAVYEP